MLYNIQRPAHYLQYFIRHYFDSLLFLFPLLCMYVGICTLYMHYYLHAYIPNRRAACASKKKGVLFTDRLDGPIFLCPVVTNYLGTVQLLRSR